MIEEERDIRKRDPGEGMGGGRIVSNGEIWYLQC
jgi:hypothetical protein